MMFGKDRGNSVLLIVDRKAQYIKLGKLTQRTSRLTLSKTKELLRRLPKRIMTNERGHEFSDQFKLKRALKIPVYVCHPYTLGERGTAENRIGILRKYLKKGFNLKTLKHATINRIENEISNRPMKCLDWKTPYQVLLSKKVALIM